DLFYFWLLLFNQKGCKSPTKVRTINEEVLPTYRAVCEALACWRIFDFPIHSREPDVQILNVHLENMQRLNFRERDRLDIIVNMPDKKKTTLTEWVVRTKNSLGRLTYVYPNSDDLFYFWLLLFNQKGCKSPTEVRTINEEVLPTYRAVCEALVHIDEYISVEIPNPVEDLRGYKVVTKLMMHGPFGATNPGAACMENKDRNKHFSK
nr:DNA helicase [Tanacetum cinerariifolium]